MAVLGEVHQHNKGQKLLEDDDTAQVAGQREMGGREAPNTTRVTVKTCIWYVFLFGRREVIFAYVRKLWKSPLETVFLLFGTMIDDGTVKKKSRVVHDGEGSQQFRLRHRRLHAYDPLPLLHS